MKKLVIALTALAAFTGSASRPISAPALTPRLRWRWLRPTTGPASTSSAAAAAASGLPNGGVNVTAAAACIVCTNTRTGGDGWFGTVGAGYDWQGGSVVGGRHLRRRHVRQPQGQHRGCRHIRSCRHAQKMETAWAAGGRVGYLVAPNVLSYVNGGYTGTYWTRQHLGWAPSPAPRSGLHTDSFNTQGWFIGGGVENNLSFFGSTRPAGS